MHRFSYYYSRALRVARYLWLQRKYDHLHITSIVSRKAIVYGSQGISLGPRVIIHPYANLQCTLWNTTDQLSGKITIGEGTTIQPHAYLWTEGGDISIGRFCSVNPFCVLYGQGGLKIGDYVRIATHTVIVPGNHNFNRMDIPIAEQGNTMLGVEIQNDVWIGAGVTILDGVNIAQGCVIAAGSVITKSTQPQGIYAGTPAKRIKDRVSLKVDDRDIEKRI
jgi:acetyltransferase-like isoleucine patch superfamily enzyme